MNINVHIERLVLDGMELGPGQGELVRAAVVAELTRLLAAGGLGAQLQSGAALPSLPAGALHLEPAGGPAQIGQRIARAVYGGIGEAR